MSRITTRTPIFADASTISAIDARSLATGHATFRQTPHDWTSFKTYFLTRHGLGLIAENSNSEVGWAGVSPTSTRAVYQGVGEVSIQVLSDGQRSGIGQQLLRALVRESEHAGYWTLIAQVFPESQSSITLHRGFELSHHRHQKKLRLMCYGPFADRWRDVVFLERRSQVVG
ncbi:GNAT family N-acetyltransferase [Aliiroseovarius sp. 2305UL8-7]|uniref:GNAT family N-acetyltransferase n=1 Tax=Aliiroseovarius conchicola TaxID=3121637 RepID=UPI00352717D1